VASLLVVAACIVLASASVWAQSPVLVGRVTEVTDEDTIQVALASGPIIVRLHSIDTPKRSQPWGRQATAALERRLRNGTQVTLQPITQDKYDRLVAVVYLKNENVNAWMVQQGHAWAYRQYWTMRSSAPGSSRRGRPA
jgi:endonuclease YncB( thermonuclease family)